MGKETESKPIQEEQYMRKRIFLLGTAAYAVLLSLALYFFLERTAFLDIAFHLFYIIKDGDFAIQNNRYGAFVTQIWPLLASKIGLPLKSIMQLYSGSFVLFFYFVFASCLLVFKSYRFALAMLLLSTLMVTDTFYWIQSEFGQGLASLIFFFAFLKYRSDHPDRAPWLLNPLMYLMILTLVFFHPLNLFPFVFASVFLLLHKELKPRLLTESLLTYLAIFATKSIFFRTTYDSGSMGGLRNFLDLFPNYFTIQSNKDLFYYLQDYYLLFLFFAAMLIYYFVSRKFLKLFLLASFFCGYLLLVNVSYAQGAEQFYMENLYMPLSVFVIFALVFDGIDRIPRSWILPALLLFLTIRIGSIAVSHKPYTERLTYLQNYLESTNALKPAKRVISSSQLDKDIMLMHWATPYEFWLLSTIQTGQTRSIIALDDPASLHWAKEGTSNFITQWGVFPYEELPGKYFPLQDYSPYHFEGIDQ